MPAALPCRSREKSRVEGTSGDHLNHQQLRAGFWTRLPIAPQKTSPEYFKQGRLCHFPGQATPKLCCSYSEEHFNICRCNFFLKLPMPFDSYPALCPCEEYLHLLNFGRMWLDSVLPLLFSSLSKLNSFNLSPHIKVFNTLIILRALHSYPTFPMLDHIQHFTVSFVVEIENWIC